jgi:hypothetical protein
MWMACGVHLMERSFTRPASVHARQDRTMAGEQGGIWVLTQVGGAAGLRTGAAGTLLARFAHYIISIKPKVHNSPLPMDLQRGDSHIRTHSRDSLLRAEIACQITLRSERTQVAWTT